MAITDPASVPNTGTRLDLRSSQLARNWWIVALRGGLGVLFGILTLMLPGVTLLTLVLVFAAYLLVDGVLGIVAGVRAAQAGQRWGLLIVEGIVSILGAIAAMALPDLAIVFFLYLVAFLSILSGAFLVVAAFQLHLDHGRWLLAAAGVISLIFGIMLALYPITGAVVLALWLGVYAIAFGAALLVLGLRLRGRFAAAPSAGGTVSPPPATTTT
jgi:uncharacterized membrane protein HdeD (DUF308 family)